MPSTCCSWTCCAAAEPEKTTTTRCTASICRSTGFLPACATADKVAPAIVWKSSRQFVRDHCELDKIGDSKGHADCGIRRVPATGHQDTSNPRMLVPCVHRVPRAF